MHAYFANLISAVIAALSMLCMAALAAGPSRDQCSCPVADSDKAAERYSTIVNASLCVSTSGTPPEPRCAVTVHCLDDGRTGPNCGQHPRSLNWPRSSVLFEILPTLVDAHFKSRGVDLPEASRSVQAAVKSNFDLLDRCWNNFRNLGIGEIKEPRVSVARTATATCVNTLSGWIHISMPYGGSGQPPEKVRHLTFQFSPLRATGR